MQVVAAALAADVDRLAAEVKIFHAPAFKRGSVDLTADLNAALAGLGAVKAEVSDDLKSQRLGGFCRLFQLAFRELCALARKARNLRLFKRRLGYPLLQDTRENIVGGLS